MQKKVFYSWQSDLPNATNRGFIQQALEQAAALISGDISIDVEPVVDRDTAGVGGSPDIAGTILDKIDKADVFVPDVSITTTDSSGKNYPNPNVLVELGFAAKALGWEQVVMVMNTAFGEPIDLPFDLRSRRVISYSVGEDVESKAEERKLLTKKLVGSLSTVFQNPDGAAQAAAPQSTPLEEAIRSVKSIAPDRSAVIRRFMEHTERELAMIEPDLGSRSPEFQSLKDALDASVPFVADFGHIALRAAEMADAKSLSKLFSGLEGIAAKYKFQGSGSYYEHQFDYWRFIGYELMVMLTACMIREGLWETLGEILKQDLILDHTNRNRRNLPFSYLCQEILLCEIEGKKRGLASYQADLLKNRHSTGPLVDTGDFTAFVEADYFLYLRATLPLKQGYGWSLWVPHSVIHMEQPPRYLIEAERIDMAQQLASAIGVESPATLSDLLSEHHSDFAHYFSGRTWLLSPFRDHMGIIKRIGSR